MAERSRRKPGRPTLDFIQKHFVYHEDVGKSVCRSCSFAIKGNKSTHLERHLDAFHKPESAEIKNERKRVREAKDAEDAACPAKRKKDTPHILVKLDQATVRSAVVLHTTVDGNSFKSLEGVGLRMILNPILEALNRSSTDKLTVNRKVIHDMIKNEAAKLREEISKEVDGKMVCLKVDAGSRLDRRVVSLNIQYVDGGKLVVRNLGIKETTERHSATFLNELILDTLHNFNILCNQVLSGTADNGANVKAAVRSLPGPNLSTAQFQCYHATLDSEDEYDVDDCNDLATSLSALDQGPSTSTSDSSGDPSLSSPASSVCSDVYSFRDEQSGEESDSLTELEDGLDERDSAEEDDLFPNLGELDRAQEDQDVGLADADVCEQCLAIKHGVQFSGVVYVPCAAHTLQLAVDEAVNVGSVQSAIKRAKRLAVKLRTHHYSVQLKKKGFNKAVLGNDTRWGSTYAMMESLIKLRPAIEEICEAERAAKTVKRKKTCNNNKKKTDKNKKKTDKNKKDTNKNKKDTDKEDTQKKKARELSDFDLTPYQWRQVIAYCRALEPSAMTTKKLQAADLTAGQFYGEWKACLRRTDKVGTLLARRVLDAMKKREKTLTECEVFLPAVFMDPRYKCLLTAEERKNAMKYLQDLSARLDNLGAPEGETSNSGEEDDVDDDDDVLENILKSNDKKSMPTQEDSLTKTLLDYNDWDRVAKETDIFQYWYDRREKNPILFRLATVMLAVPMTQVSVERTFSHFKQILNMLRFSLSSEILNDVLFLKCNYHLSK